MFGTTTAYAFAIDLHGDFMVVGDRDGDFGPPNAHHNTGAAYVYRRDAAGTWELEQTLLPDVLGGETHHELEGDEFGDAVAIWGDTVVIGAPGEDSANAGVDADPNDDGAERAGAAYVFVRGGDGQWQQQAYLKAFNPDAFDAFGRSVAIHADRIAVGADGERSVSTTESPDPHDNGLGLAGAVYVFDRSGTTWTQTGYLKPFNLNVTAPFVGDRMGPAVRRSCSGTEEPARCHSPPHSAARRATGRLCSSGIPAARRGAGQGDRHPGVPLGG